jgi:murein DD-endopeptidase MepM/ murein hydrolase activator NlpD
MKKLNEEISRLRKLMNLNESSLSAKNIFGGNNVSIPKDGAHAGQSGWQSSEAWDIPGQIGTPVYSVTTGTLQTFNDYGENVTKTQGKRLFGQSFTVKGDNGMPDVYYTHLKDCKVKKGDKVQCGELLGYIMDFPNSSYDHLHIGVKPPGTIRDLIDSNGKIKCSSGKFATKTGTDDSISGGTKSKNGEEYYDSFITSMIKSAIPFLKEGKIYNDFGRNIKISYNEIVLPEKSNNIIESPIS